MSTSSRLFVFLFFANLWLTACSVQPSPTTAPFPIPTATVAPPTPTIMPPPAPTRTPTPTAAPRTLTVCMGAEPDSLSIFWGAMLAKSNILEAIYDGPIDTNGFDYQPVILQKLPNLNDGDARLEAVSVRAGDRVVNDAEEAVSLAAGEKVRPYGCQSSDCAVSWDGGALQMAQLSADFRLIEGLKWSDGAPLTTRDSVFSYHIARQCQDDYLGRCSGFGLVTYSQTTVDRTASYTALNDLTVRWVGLPGFLDPNYRVNFFTPLPEHQLKDYPPDQLFDLPEASEKPLGWGPYIIEKWTLGVSISLRKNPHYFRAAEGLPRFDRLTFRFIGNQDLDQNLAAILSGECDILDQEAAFFTLSEGMGTLLEMDAAGQLRAHFTTGTSWEHADFSLLHADYDNGYQPATDRPDLFGDVRTRRAIAVCIDRQKIVDEVLLGKSEVLDSYLPKNHPLFNPNVRHYDFDVAAATALLDEVGWIDADGDPTTPRLARGVANVPDGTPLSFSFATTTATLRQLVTQIVAESLAQCGVQVELEYFPASEFFADPPAGQVFNRRYDMVEFAWLTGVTPPCDVFTTENIPGDPSALDENGLLRFPTGWKGQNDSGYRNPEYDAACRTAFSLLPGQPGYRAAHFAAQEIFAADLPVIPLFLRTKVTVTRADLCGYGMDPTARSDTWNIEAYDFGEGCR